MSGRYYLAFDLGAESGRAVVGRLSGEELSLEVLHRFRNGPVEEGETQRWHTEGIWSEIRKGLALAGEKCGGALAGIGLDTWGVDFGLLDSGDNLIENPYHYRDSRTDGMMEEAFRLLPREEIFERTGIQFMQLNSLFQLLAMAREGSPALKEARSFLNMPDLFHFMLSGRKANEFTIATTTQCYDPRRGDWAVEMLEALGIPTRIFGEIVPPGTVLDMLRDQVAEETGCPCVPVITPAAHDTGSAVAAVPAESGDFIYISSGTWSLMGVEVEEPVINPLSLEYNFTNEGGVGGTFRLLKNIMGLWLVQECRREWSRSGMERSHEELVSMAQDAPAFGPIVDPGDSRFLHHGDMPSRIREFCSETGQAIPATEGEIVRCALESLALEYRWVAGRLEELVGRNLPVVHIIGGGSQNRLLNQFTSDATGRPVTAGPVEATAIGNLLVQAMALGDISSREEMRSVVRRSFTVEIFEPGDASGWDEAYQRYMKIKMVLHNG